MSKKKLPKHRNPNKYNPKLKASSSYEKLDATPLPEYLIAPLDIEKIESIEAEIDTIRNTKSEEE